MKNNSDNQLNLFNKISRTYTGPALFSEPEYKYINRSARPQVEEIRNILQKWFSRYPISDQKEFQARFCSNDDISHQSAFFELIIHEMLLQMNCKIKIHPDVGDKNNKKHPDFLVSTSSGMDFYIEAVIATGKTEKERAANARMNEVYDSINRLYSPNFFIGMDIAGAPDSPPNGRKIRAFLKACMNDIDPDEMSHKIKSEGINALPHWNYKHEGWDITFHPIPKTEKFRGKIGVRTIGLRSFEMKFIDTTTSIRNAIINKASRYGHLKIPYVIAVNCLDDNTVDRIDIMDSLFGKECYNIAYNSSTGINDIQMTRDPNGAWIGKSGLKNTRISAVLITVNLTPWTIGTSVTYLIHNPWAKYEYNSVLSQLPQGKPQEGFMDWTPGLQIYEILGLSQGWPYSH